MKQIRGIERCLDVIGRISNDQRFSGLITDQMQEKWELELLQISLKLLDIADVMVEDIRQSSTNKLVKERMVI